MIGYKKAYANDHDDQMSVMKKSVEALEQVYGTKYKYGTISEVRILHFSIGEFADHICIHFRSEATSMAQFVRPSIRQYVYSYVVCMSLSIIMYVLMSDKIDISLEHLSLLEAFYIRTNYLEMDVM